MDRGRCRKRRGGGRNALRASAGVRARSVMVNSLIFGFVLRGEDFVKITVSSS